MHPEYTAMRATTQAPPRQTFADFALDGFAPGYPPWAGPAAECIDRRVLAELPCPACDAPGLEYRPYHRAAGRRYRAFARCPRCGHVEEY